MNDGSFLYRKMKEGLDIQLWQVLKHEPDHDIGEEIIKQYSVHYLQGITLWQHLFQDLVEEDAKHQQVEPGNYKEKPDDDIQHQVLLPDWRTGCGFDLKPDKSEKHKISLLDREEEKRDHKQD